MNDIHGAGLGPSPTEHILPESKKTRGRDKPKERVALRTWGQ